jgi:hypothetical protein
LVGFAEAEIVAGLETVISVLTEVAAEAVGEVGIEVVEAERCFGEVVDFAN